MSLTVRNIDQDLWRQLRMVALARGVTVGDLLSDILREWLKTNKNV